MRAGRGTSRFQSTLPARGATPATPGRPASLPISIHAPRTGSDTNTERGDAIGRDFNPRSPHGERLTGLSITGSTETISIHAPRTGSDKTLTLENRAADAFQSTLPARGATRSCKARRTPTHYFNPRSPHGERQPRMKTCRLDEVISIHAPRTGSDLLTTPAFRGTSHFNPRSPHGERHHN